MFSWDLTQTVLQYIMNMNIERSYVQELQERLQNKHIEDMQAQMSAHKCTVESIKEQAEKAKLTDIQALRDQFTKEKGMWTMARTVYSSLCLVDTFLLEFQFLHHKTSLIIKCACITFLESLYW